MCLRRTFSQATASLYFCFLALLFMPLPHGMAAIPSLTAADNILSSIDSVTEPSGSSGPLLMAAEDDEEEEDDGQMPGD